MFSRAAMMLLMMLLTATTAGAQEAISGLTYNSTGGYYEINDAQDLIDLATYVNKANTLKNIRLVNCSITSTSGNAAGIVVSAAKCNIENCEVTGTIDAHSYYAGGIVADMSGGSITGCFASGSVQARSKTGSSYLHGMIAGQIISTTGSVTTIAYGAFANCKGLVQFNINHDGAVTLGNSNAFEGCDALQYIVFSTPAGALANTSGN